MDEETRWAGVIMSRAETARAIRERLEAPRRVEVVREFINAVEDRDLDFEIADSNRPTELLRARHRVRVTAARRERHRQHAADRERVWLRLRARHKAGEALDLAYYIGARDALFKSQVVAARARRDAREAFDEYLVMLRVERLDRLEWIERQHEMLQRDFVAVEDRLFALCEAVERLGSVLGVTPPPDCLEEMDPDAIRAWYTRAMHEVASAGA